MRLIVKKRSRWGISTCWVKCARAPGETIVHVQFGAKSATIARELHTGAVFKRLDTLPALSIRKKKKRNTLFTRTMERRHALAYLLKSHAKVGRQPFKVIAPLFSGTQEFAIGHQ